jgi:hypothetical protein
VITKVLLSAALTLGAAVAVATPASADPNMFGTLGCSCQGAVGASTGGAPTGGASNGAPLTDQVNQGITGGSAEVKSLRH